jgi:hypothetical protein
MQIIPENRAELMREAAKLLRSANSTDNSHEAAEQRRRANECVEEANRLELAARRPLPRAEWLCPEM